VESLDIMAPAMALRRTNPGSFPFGSQFCALVVCFCYFVKQNAVNTLPNTSHFCYDAQQLSRGLDSFINQGDNDEQEDYSGLARYPSHGGQHCRSGKRNCNSRVNYVRRCLKPDPQG
jgi:hypothetical protein